MRLKIRLRSAFVNIFEYLFVIILILNCNTIWTSYEETSLNRILKVLLVIVTLLYVIAKKTIYYADASRILMAGGLCIIYFLVYALIVNYRSSNFFYFLINVFCIYVFTRLAERSSLGGDIGILFKYENIIIIIAVISLFFWLFGSTLGLLHSTGYVYSTWTGNGTIKRVPAYYNLYFETQSIAGIIRNTGIFTEAPMCNFHLCIALLAELFCKHELSKAKCAVLIITIVTTISTTGWCMLVIALFAKYVVDNNVKGFWRTIRIAVVPFIFVAGIILVQSLVMDKLGSSSGSVRLDDFKAGFEAWKTNPFFGAGYGNSDYVKRFMSLFRSNNQGFSNSPMRILYQGGIFLVVPYIYFASKWVSTCIKRRDIQWFLFFACFIFLFAITSISYKFLTVFLFMAYGIDRKKTATK